MLSIGVLGDVMLGRGVGEQLASRRPADVWSDELRSLLASLDLVIANLECCVSERGRPTELVPGKPFFFRGPRAAIEALEAAGVRAVGLANNHALDFGEDALADTLEFLAGAGIAVAGAGLGVDHARRAAVVEAADTSIGLVAMSDHPEVFQARPGQWGIAYAPLEEGVPAWLVEEIRAVRERCDLVIAFPHWGPNMTASPASWQLDVAHELQTAGADLVAGHSAHVFHGVGWSEHGPLLFDLGDALDDYRVDRKLRNDLGLLAIWRPGVGDEEIELTGLKLGYCFTEVARDDDADWIARRLDLACGELGTRVTRLDEARFRVNADGGTRTPTAEATGS